MANLPTAYASQRFGAKALDFYAASGEVIGADPRARADERRLQDIDGARHTVRLMEAKFDLEPGDQASVLRLQPGPARRSRPVAVVNHSRGGWTRTHPGASALLSRAGVARNVNWLITMGLFAAAALAIVWPYLAAFMAELIPTAFSGLPVYDLHALAAASAPGLASWSLADATAPLAALLGRIRPGLESFAPGLAYAAATLAGAAVVFAARSWRLLWAPLFVAALGAGALGFAAPAASLSAALFGLGLSALVFLIGGAWNRIADAVRLEARIALLADHLLSNAPAETVTAPDGEAEPAQAESEPTDAPARDEVLVDEKAAATVAASLRALEAGDPFTAGAGAPPGADETQASTAAPVETEAGEQGAQGEAEPLPGAPDAGPGADIASGGGETGAGEATQASAEPPGEAAAGAAPEDTEPQADPDDQPADPDAAGEASRAAAHAPAGLDAEEAERLRTDPRYASRAIILPPPPPMPAPGKPAETEDAGPAAGAAAEPEPAGADAGALETAGAPATRTLNPGKPLPDNVVPIFAAPPPTKD
ncbi:MAG: hypothetical protein ACLFQ5_09295 [Oceanicaulis sp.]